MFSKKPAGTLIGSAAISSAFAGLAIGQYFQNFLMGLIAVPCFIIVCFTIPETWISTWEGKQADPIKVHIALQEKIEKVKRLMRW